MERNQPQHTLRQAPKIYKAIITQTGTNDPTATELINTLGETPVYSRTALGSYAIQLQQEMPDPKKVYLYTKAINAISTIQWSNDTTIEFWTAADDSFTDSPILIEIYP